MGFPGGNQLVKNPPAMWETWVRSLDWEDPLEKGEKGWKGQTGGTQEQTEGQLIRGRLGKARRPLRHTHT